MRWLQSIAALSVVVVSALASAGTVVAGEAKDRGNAAGNAALGQYGNKDAFRQNLAVPMTNAETQMKTVDGSKTFDAAMGIPSSNRFLQLLIQPGSSGDLSTVIIGQDLNSDGTFDHTFTVGPVSGVCANGYIKCTPGTWNNCTPFKWVSDAEGKLAVESTGITDLGGCYCINSSCGSTLAWNNSSILLRDLGGGAVGAIHAQDASVMITNVATDVVTITYYGQLVRSASSAKDKVKELANTPSVQHQQSYYGSFGALEAASTSAVMAGNADPASMYYQIKNSPAIAGPASTNKCTVRRDSTMTATPSTSFSETGSLIFPTEHFIDMQVWRASDKKTYRLQLMDHWAGTDHHGTMGRGDHPPMEANGWHTLKEFVIPMDDGVTKSDLKKAIFSIRIVSGGGCTPGSVYTIDAAAQGFNNRINVGGYCSGGGVQTPLLEWSYLFEYGSDKYQEAVVDNCSSFASNPTCKLKDEVADGVVTARGFAGTGLKPLPSCRTFNGAVTGDMEICREWWKKERTYVCDTSKGFDLTAAGRFHTVATSATDNVNQLNYNDRRLINGAWTSHNNLSITLPERDVYDECESACKVKRPKKDTQVGVQGVLSSGRISSDSFDFMYYNCESGGTVCPALPGEEIVTPCTCVNAFAEAATIMATMRMGGADNICSSGVPQK